ncbi:MAG: carboxypeptidase regulatory-like domain-containing protein [Clostridia bacterium]|nr:carboxypeptidase regulatory-like domain-containing protein [Clostridia bacterium]
MNSVKRLVLCLLALALGLSLTGAAAEGATQLQLTFIGMYATSDGGYASRNLTGSFQVYQNGEHVGVIESDENGSQPLTLDVSGNVQLIPVMETIPADIAVNEQGYTVSVVAGRTNYAPVVVFAKAGLFRVHTESQAEFSLISEESEVVMTFSTDSKGDYALPVAIPAGQYTLRMESASLAISPWRDKVINIMPYTGPDSVVMIDASYYYTPQVTLNPSTPTPSPTPTAVPVTPTPAPAAQATQSAAPADPATATPTPTATPTATPVPKHGTLSLQAIGDEGAKATYNVYSTGVTYGEGELVAGESVNLHGLAKGNYIVTINMGDDVALTGLNGYPSLQRRAAQWLVSVSAGKTSVYQLELSLLASISGEVKCLQDVQVSITGTEVHNLTANGAFSVNGMVPDTYTVTCVLPSGRYQGEGWSFVDAAGQTLAVTQVVLSGGDDVVLPPVEEVELGSVSGVVHDEGGAALAGVAVSLCNGQGDVVASATTGEDGSWSITGVAYGDYVLQYEAGADAMIPTDGVSVTDESPRAEVAATRTTPASLLVRVFDDSNNNGVLGKNESFLPGVVVSLISREGGQDVTMSSAVTDGAGEVRLYAPAGSYTLRCELPADYGFASRGSKDLISNSSMELSIDRVQDASVTLRQGVETEFGIGAMQMCTISGTVWHDENGDGLWQADEGGVEGMRITAEGTRNGLLYEAYTDADGRYEIRQIRNGTYKISYHVPDGYVFTYKASGAKQQRSIMTTEADRVASQTIEFERGDVLDEQNIGLVTECVVEGVCFLDSNYNGVFDDGEPVLSGVQVELFRQSNNKRLLTTTTDENGVYRFGHVRADVFKVKALLPKGYVFTMTAKDDPDGNQFEPKSNNGREQALMDVPSQNGQSTRVLIGAISYGTLTGVVYYDSNFSGDWETGEKIAQGITVTLLNDAGEAIKTAKTNSNGAYTFDKLVPGAYCISVAPANGYAFTTTGSGSVVRNSEGLGVSDPIDLALGGTVSGLDAGMILPAKVEVRVFADANDNGKDDAGEKGLTGTIVTLVDESGVVASTTIGADGKFVFQPVLPGRYQLTYELPEGAEFAALAQGGNSIAAEGTLGAGEWFEAGAGSVITAPLCGGLYLGVIDGHAFADSDGSGVQEASEADFAGLTLTLTPSREDLTERVVTTGADGSFSMTDLRPDTYTLRVDCPEGYVLSLLPDVTLPLSHGLSEQTITVKVEMGGQYTAQQLGCVMPATYTGSAWLDENSNGLWDEGERPAAGEMIELIEQRSGSVVAQMTTSDNGSFRAEGLAPGLYTLSFALSDDVTGAPDGQSTFAEDGNHLIMADIPVTEGSDATGALLGLVRQTTLAGHVWLDVNGDIRMVSGAVVTLMQADSTLAEATTGEDGAYTFGGLMPGEYVISVKLPGSCLVLRPGDRRLTEGGLVSILTECDVNTGRSGIITVEMAQHQLNLDIGSVKQGRLGDRCWLDLNGNGLQDDGEGGLPGVEITLLLEGEAVATTVSDQYGYYVFSKLYPGEYTLRVNAPAEVKPTVARTDLPQIVSVLTESGDSIVLPVVSDGVNYAADLGFVLVREGAYPAGYGEGATQDWTKLN